MMLRTVTANKLPGDVLLHEPADSGGRMRLEVGEGVADERPTGATRREVQPLPPPFGEVDIEEQRHQSGREEEQKLFGHQHGHEFGY